MRRTTAGIVLALLLPLSAAAQARDPDQQPEDSLEPGIDMSDDVDAANVKMDPAMEKAGKLAGSGNSEMATAYATRALALLRESRRSGESNVEKALVDANRAVAKAPRNLRARIVRAELYAASGQTGKAIADLDAAVDADRADPEPLNARGVLLARQGNYQKAIADFTAALDATRGPYPKRTHQRALFNRGYVHEKLGENAEALADYDAAILADPKFVTALAMRGLLRERLGRIDDAVYDFKAADELQISLGAQGMDDIDLIAVNMAADAEHQPRKAPGRFTVLSLDNVGITLVGPLPEEKDVLHRRSTSDRGSDNERSAARPDSNRRDSAATASYLSADEVFDLLRGNTTDGVMASTGTYTEYYDPDGSIHDGDSGGTWWMKDEKFCTSYPGMKSSCYRVRRAANGMINWIADGEVVGTARVVTGNPKNY